MIPALAAALALLGFLAWMALGATAIILTTAQHVERKWPLAWVITLVFAEFYIMVLPFAILSTRYH